METTSVAILRKELKMLSASELNEILLKIVKRKKENKEMLEYLLHYADDEEGWRRLIAQEIQNGMREIKGIGAFSASTTIKKTIRAAERMGRYSGDKQTIAEMRIALCRELRKLPVSLLHNMRISKIFLKQTQAARTAIGNLHPDLQYDLTEALEEILHSKKTIHPKQESEMHDL